MPQKIWSLGWSAFCIFFRVKERSGRPVLRSWKVEVAYLIINKFEVKGDGSVRRVASALSPPER